MASREFSSPMSASPSVPVRPVPARPAPGSREEARPAAADQLEPHWAEAIDSATD
jgi:hypothetical protein